jgi:biotin operon repressor
MTIKQQILEQLRRHPSTMHELVSCTKSTNDSIRGRISELRYAGYQIKNIKNIYTLEGTTTPQSAKLIHWLEKNKYYGKVLDYTTLSIALGLSRNEVEKTISMLFAKYRITQVSKNSCKINKI